MKKCKCIIYHKRECHRGGRDYQNSYGFFCDNEYYFVCENGGKFVQGHNEKWYEYDSKYIQFDTYFEEINYEIEWEDITDEFEISRNEKV